MYAISACRRSGGSAISCQGVAGRAAAAIADTEEDVLDMDDLNKAWSKVKISA